MNKLKSSSRLWIGVSALLMVVAYFVPVWQILMWAPQYPEGLEMKIWLHTLTGDYKIISGLNHYIGMKHIEISMFPEFQYMPYIVGALIFVGLAAAFVKRKIGSAIYAGAIVVAGLVGMVDFYLWGYDYGHNLDPTAPIIVPGMAYQPPLIGTKQLLNFTAFSGPDIGGYVFLASGLIALGIAFVEFRGKKTATTVTLATILLTAALSTSCTASPEPLHFGKDDCHACKMIMFDNRFGAEIVTKKGKVFKFDDLNCMTSFVADNSIDTTEIAQWLVIRFHEPGNLMDATTAVYVQSPALKSPMGGNTAAFMNDQIARDYNLDLKGNKLSWPQVIERN
jgi:copper chaperone NosL